MSDNWVPYKEQRHAVPEEILNLAGYGADGATVDIVNQFFSDADGGMTDISPYLPHNFGVFDLDHGGTITFENEGQLPVPSTVMYRPVTQPVTYEYVNALIDARLGTVETALDAIVAEYGGALS